MTKVVKTLRLVGLIAWVSFRVIVPAANRQLISKVVISLSDLIRHLKTCEEAVLGRM